MLDETTEQFDETMVLEVNDLFEAYVAAGKSKDEALAKAVRYVLPDAKTASNKPSSHDTQRNISNAQDAAPNIGRAGQAGADSKRINWGALSEEDFAAIPESKKKEARGDFLT
jgi:hypothetical protein